MIEIVTGDILEAKCDAIVNPVNCVGVMGAGLARAVANRWPGILPDYKDACRNGSLVLGSVHVSLLGARIKHKQKPWAIINFPTKLHWRNSSTQAGIQSGLDALVNLLERGQHGRLINSLAVPALGCGLGGLEWSVVRPMIEAAACDLPNRRWRLYSPDSGEAAKALDPPDMTDAVYLRLLTERLRTVGWLDSDDLRRIDEIATRLDAFDASTTAVGRQNSDPIDDVR